MTPSGLVHIREMRDDIRSLPAVFSAIRERKGKYYSGVDYLKQTSSKEMSDILEISELTIKQYVKSALKKLGAQNRAQAVAELFRKGIIT